MTPASPTLSGKGLHIVASCDDNQQSHPPAPTDCGERPEKRLSVRFSLLIWLVLVGLGWLAIGLLLRLMGL